MLLRIRSILQMYSDYTNTVDLLRIAHVLLLCHNRGLFTSPDAIAPLLVET